MSLLKYRLTKDGEALLKAKTENRAKGKITKGANVYFIDTLTDEQAADLAGETGKGCQYVETVTPGSKKEA